MEKVLNLDTEQVLNLLKEAGLGSSSHKQMSAPNQENEMGKRGGGNRSFLHSGKYSPSSEQTLSNVSSSYAMAKFITETMMNNGETAIISHNTDLMDSSPAARGEKAQEPNEVADWRNETKQSAVAKSGEMFKSGNATMKAGAALCVGNGSVVAGTGEGTGAEVGPPATFLATQVEVNNFAEFRCIETEKESNLWRQESTDNSLVTRRKSAFEKITSEERPVIGKKPPSHRFMASHRTNTGDSPPLYSHRTNTGDSPPLYSQSSEGWRGQQDHQQTNPSTKKDTFSMDDVVEPPVSYRQLNLKPNNVSFANNKSDKTSLTVHAKSEAGGQKLLQSNLAKAESKSDINHQAAAISNKTPDGYANVKQSSAGLKNDPLARKLVYNQYREMLKSYSVHSVQQSTGKV